MTDREFLVYIEDYCHERSEKFKIASNKFKKRRLNEQAEYFMDKSLMYQEVYEIIKSHNKTK